MGTYAETFNAGYPLTLPGAVAPTRYVGGTTGGAPSTGTFAVGDFAIDQTGHVWICTVAGTPGTWVDAGSVGATSAQFYAPTGLTGATAVSRYVGGTTGGSPTTGTFQVGDMVVDETGILWICTGSGTPGTWRSAQADASPGSLIVIGHSYTAGSTLLDSGVSNVGQESVVARLCGLLRITEDNVLHMGQAGSALSLTSELLTGNPFGGWPGVFAFIVPPNSPNSKATADPFYPYNAAPLPGCSLLVHGVNDYGNDYNTNITGVAAVQAAYVQQAWKNALRGVLSRLRTSVIYGASITPGTGGTAQWDSSLSFSGTWNVVPNVTLNSGPAFRQSTTNGNTVTYTIPAEVAGRTVCMAFIGQQNALTYLTAAVTTTGQTAWTVNTTGPASGNSFPATNFTAIIGTEQVLVTVNSAGAWTVTRAQNGTVAATYAIGTPIQIAPQHGVAFSGTASAASGSLILGGQGMLGANVCVVKRFATIPSDAGKTIVATVQNITAGDTRAAVNFDAVGVEAASPPPIILPNLHFHPYCGSPSNVQLTGQISGFNSATAAVVAEFDNHVQIADVYTQFFNRAGTITANLNNTDVTTVIPWTANSSVITPVVGQVFSFGTGAALSGVAEHVQVTAVSGSAPNWSLTCTRGYDSSTKFAWQSGAVMAPMDWMSRLDDIHLNSAGHGVYAAILYNAFLNLPTPASLQEQGLRSASWSEFSQRRATGPTDNRWYPVPVLSSTTGTPATNRQYFLRIFVPKKSILVGMGLSSAATTATITARYGVYANGISRDMPTRMMQDFGSKTTTGASPYLIGANGTANPLTGLYQLLNPGTWWLSIAVTAITGGGTVVTVGSVAVTEQLSLAAIPASATHAPANCITQNNISGAFADAPITLGGANSFGPANDTTCPLLWYLLRTVEFL